MRALAVVAGFVVLAGVVLWLAVVAGPRTGEQRQAAAQELVNGVHLSATLAEPRFLAATAVADLGVEGGAHLVRVRILDQARLELHVTADRSVAFAEAPQLCLVGPFSAPDDAGLTDPCWGEPDVGAIVAGRWPRDGSGHPSLQEGQAVDVTAALQRGNVRCDYPPGTWQLDVVLDPLVDGAPVGPMSPSAVTLDVPFRATDVLRLLRPDESRYCGLASIVYRDQGEPPVESP